MTGTHKRMHQLKGEDLPENERGDVFLEPISWTVYSKGDLAPAPSHPTKFSRF